MNAYESTIPNAIFQKANELFEQFAEIEEVWERLKEKEETDELTPKEKKKLKSLEERAVWIYCESERLNALDYEMRQDTPTPMSMREFNKLVGIEKGRQTNMRKKGIPIPYERRKRLYDMIMAQIDYYEKWERQMFSGGFDWYVESEQARITREHDARRAMWKKKLGIKE